MRNYKNKYILVDEYEMNKHHDETNVTIAVNITKSGSKYMIHADIAFISSTALFNTLSFDLQGTEIPDELDEYSAKNQISCSGHVSNKWIDTNEYQLITDDSDDISCVVICDNDFPSIRFCNISHSFLSELIGNIHIPEISLYNIYSKYPSSFFRNCKPLILPKITDGTVYFNAIGEYRSTRYEALWMIISITSRNVMKVAITNDKKWVIFEILLTYTGEYDGIATFKGESSDGQTYEIKYEIYNRNISLRRYCAATLHEFTYVNTRKERLV